MGVNEKDLGIKIMKFSDFTFNRLVVAVLAGRGPPVTKREPLLD